MNKPKNKIGYFETLTKPSSDRRNFLRLAGGTLLVPTGGAALLAGCHSSSDDSSSTPPDPNPEVVGDIPVSVREGTNLAAAISPDGKKIAMDLQGLLWVMSVDGGTPTLLTGYFDDIARPCWSPDGNTIVFQSYRTGNFHIWAINADGTGLRQLTEGPYDHREPCFSPDGAHLAFSSDRNGTKYAIFRMELGTGEIKMVANTENENGEPAWSPDGERIAFTSGTKILVTPADGRGTPMSVAEGQSIGAPSWTPDGRGVVYKQGTTLYRSGSPLTPESEDVFPFPVSWISEDEILYTADGVIKRGSSKGGSATVIPFNATIMVKRAVGTRRRRDFDSLEPRQVKGICSPVVSPDGSKIAFAALNQIWTVDIQGGKPKALTTDGYYACHPEWSPDGKQLAYSSDRSGKFEIWLRNLDNGTERPLTYAQFPCVSSRWSPDGSSIALLDNAGHVHIADAASGDTRLLIGPLFTPGRPTWSPDGRTIALSAIRPYSSRYREGISVVLTVDVATGQATYTPAVEHMSMGPRGDDGPVWTANGKMAFAMQSLLWTMDVDEKGIRKAAPERLNDEVTDAVSATADGSVIVYLSNGRLRRVSATGGSPADIPVDLTWKLAKPAKTQVVHAGKFWDGRAASLRNDVDIVIEGNRIARIENHNPNRPGIEWIDASGYTVMPGLMDMHAHIQGKHFNTALGDREGRIFLSFGITTTRGLAELAYHSVEHKESIDSGARIAPRHFSTGEAFDGGKIYYDVMRAIYDDEQLEREIERAKALDYDLLKAYVRLPLKWQKRVVEAAHEMGAHATTHYLFPWVSFGGDGQEHMGATNRFGYSRTVSAAGTHYQDISALYAATGASRTPTLFGLNGLLGHARGTETEDRMYDLWPTWQYTSIAPSFAAQPRPLSASLMNNVKGTLGLLYGGAQVMQGTDFYIVAPAVTLHQNLWAMVEGGMTPLDALRTATSVPGDFLGQGHGSLEAGKLADLICVEGDPLADIKNASKVRGAMVGGFYHTMEELIEPFRGKDGSARGAAVAAAPQTGHARLFAAGPGVAATAKYAMYANPAKSGSGALEYWWHDPDYVVETMKLCCVQI